MVSKTHLIYFSPTKTTKKIVEQIAAGLNAPVSEHYDLTQMEQGLDMKLDDGLAIIGIPVYAGRTPEIVLRRIQKLSATGIPVVLVALYGNRAFEDALVELRDVVVSKGFTVVAAGAFIGEHSYSTSKQPIAVNRPDMADLQKAKEFGTIIAKELQKQSGKATPEIPGDVPYKERAPLGGISPETDRELCTLCAICAKVCPTFIITVNSDVITDAKNCIMCCACVKYCPEKARELKHPMVEGRREMLIKNCSERKDPVFFYEPSLQ
ncbi:MAG: 4Fe-4S binding protein [Desulfuromonadaceae bacterium]|nr:4Fe-4S binding protein [Desulfuromonadaceae bacterium]